MNEYVISQCSSTVVSSTKFKLFACILTSVLESIFVAKIVNTQVIDNRYLKVELFTI